MKMKLYIQRLMALTLVFSMLSCEKMMQSDSSMKIEAEDHYSSVGEVYSAFMGLFASFSKVAEQTIILSALKGDLLQPTSNAPEDYWRVYRYESTSDASQVNNAKVYYDIVINCNDFLKRVITYNKEIPGDIPSNTYKGMISAAINFKVWSLMTVGKLYGEARFYNSAVTTDNQEGMFLLTIDDLPHFLLSYMRGGEDGVDAFNAIDWTVLLSNTNTSWPGRALEADALYGELCLWAGNYQEAANHFIKVLSVSADLNRNLGIYGGGDWKKMFADDVNQREMISVLTFNANNRQEHNLRHYFSDAAPNVYYFAPTNCAVNYFESEMLNAANSYKRGDLRGEGVTYTTESGQTVVNKYSLKISTNEYADDAYIHVYRAGGVSLMLAEAFCFLKNYDAALALLDNGIAADYYKSNSWLPPFAGMFSNFSSGNNGVRGRVQLLQLEKADIFKGCVESADSLSAVTGRIADEVARELAYEGQRWFTLIRMARNIGNPGFLADRVALKFNGDEEKYKAVLKNEKNWFIK